MRSPVLYGKYLLLERISVGGMAEVFKAKTFGPDGFEKIVAIKRILPSMAEDEDFITMFIDEAKIAGQLSHANICQIFELGKIGSSHFIAMEYVQGKDVLQIQNRFRRLRQQMPLSMAAHIAAKVCEGLDYAHRKCDKDNQPLNIIHRDVSPQNILVSYEGEVKIIDFGIAKAVSRSSKTQAGVLKGKFGYMSPEQVRGLPLDRRSDTFAIGTLLWEMCTDERLFAGPSDFAVLEKVRNATVPPPSSHNPMIPPELEAIIMRALKRDPMERYQWGTDMQEALQNYLLSQSPPWSAASLSSTLKDLFAREMSREQAALEQYKRISEDDLSKYAAPAARRESAVSLLQQEGRSPHAATPIHAVQAQPTATNTDEAIVAAPEQVKQDPTQVAGPLFAPATGGTPVEAIQVTESEEFDDGATLIYGGADEDEGSMPGEPTFVFSADLGKIQHAAERPIFDQPPSSGNGHSSTSLDHGPTVVFNYEDVVRAPALVERPHASTTATVTAPSTLFKDILIGVLSATVLILTGALVWFVLLTRAPAIQTGALVVSTDEPGSTRVLVDGQSKGTVSPGSPVTIRGLKVGRHRLVLSPEDGDPVARSVEVSAGEVKVVPVSWGTAAPQAVDAGTGAAVVDSGVRDTASPTVTAEGRTGATVRQEPRPAPGLTNRSAREGAVARRTRPRRPRTEVQPKSPRRQRRRERDGRPPRARSSDNVPRNRARRQAVDDKPVQQSGPGYLVANTVPWAKVMIDGKSTGRNTPIPPNNRLELAPGRHRVTFVVGEEEFSYTVDIRSADTLKLIKKLPVDR